VGLGDDSGAVVGSGEADYRLDRPGAVAPPAVARMHVELHPDGVGVVAQGQPRRDDTDERIALPDPPQVGALPLVDVPQIADRGRFG
jgi:hypothetical protein